MGDCRSGTKKETATAVSGTTTALKFRPRALDLRPSLGNILVSLGEGGRLWKTLDYRRRPITTVESTDIAARPLSRSIAGKEWSTIFAMVPTLFIL